jgi:GH25 family lysozyme M1 (1,4-beta-N-acetylmuramidase)
MATCDGGSWKSEVEFPCFHRAGRDVAVIEGFDGGQGESSAIGICSKEAHKANMRVSVYAFMCPRCGNGDPEGDAAKFVRSLKDKGVEYEHLYWDIETCPGCWGDAKENIDFVKALVKGAESEGAPVAFYSNPNEWSQVMGDDRSFSKYPIWYANYDWEENYHDWRDFGGWTHPHMKQYGDHSDCGCFQGVDVNWYE